jgi:hypothetical protein
MTVKEAGEAVPAEVWRKALLCGDLIDRLPCRQCGATNLAQCTKPLTQAQITATRDYVNGYGFKAAYALAGLSQ